MISIFTPWSTNDNVDGLICKDHLRTFFRNKYIGGFDAFCPTQATGKTQTTGKTQNCWVHFHLTRMTFENFSACESFRVFELLNFWIALNINVQKDCVLWAFHYIYKTIIIDKWKRLWQRVWTGVYWLLTLLTNARKNKHYVEWIYLHIWGFYCAIVQNMHTAI